MESEEPEIKSKQASKKDRTLREIEEKKKFRKNFTTLWENARRKAAGKISRGFEAETWFDHL